MVREKRIQKGQGKRSCKAAPHSLEIEQMTVAQYLDKFLETEKKAMRDAWELGDKKFAEEIKRMDDDIIQRTQVKNEEFEARKAHI